MGRDEPCWALAVGICVAILWPRFLEKWFLKKSGICARHDELIEQLLADERYRVLPTGVIFTCRDMGGHTTETWRRADWLDSIQGYRRVRYARVHLAAHRVIYRAHIGPLDPGLQINHKDGIRHNNHPSNLELVTQSENILHSYRELGHPKTAGRAKITGTVAERIRQLHERGVPYKNLAFRFDLSKSTISYIVNRKTWKGVSNG